MSKNREDRSRETGTGAVPAEGRAAEANRQPADALTDEDARTPDTSPTEEEPTWRSAEASGRQVARPPTP